MAFLRAGIALGVELFLIVDMAVVHQLLRLDGLLFSNYFEYAVLLAGSAFAAKSLISRKWSFKDQLVRFGVLIGFGGILFFDAVIVDQVLKLGTINYPQSINIGSGMIGLVLVVVGLYGWQTARNLVPTRFPAAN
jgi:uncharacterized membrane protein